MPQPFIGTSGYSIVELRGLLENLLGRQQHEVTTGFSTAEDYTKKGMSAADQLASLMSAQGATNVTEALNQGQGGAGDVVGNQMRLKDYFLTQAMPARAQAKQTGFGQLAQLGLGESQANQALLGNAWAQQLGLNEQFLKQDALNKKASGWDIASGLLGIAGNLLPGIGSIMSASKKT